MSVEAGAAQVPTPAMRHIRPPERLHLGENAVKHWKNFSPEMGVICPHFRRGHDGAPKTEGFVHTLPGR